MSRRIEITPLSKRLLSKRFIVPVSGGAHLPLLADIDRLDLATRLFSILPVQPISLVSVS